MQMVLFLFAHDVSYRSLRFLLLFCCLVDGLLDLYKKNPPPEVATKGPTMKLNELCPPVLNPELKFLIFTVLSLSLC